MIAQEKKAVVRCQMNRVMASPIVSFGQMRNNSGEVANLQVRSHGLCNLLDYKPLCIAPHNSGGMVGTTE